MRALGACGVLACAATEREPAGGVPSVSASEQALIRAQLARLGVAAEDVSFGGARVFLQQDAFLYAADVLASIGPVDKGRVPTLLALENSGFTGCGVEVCGALAPVQFAVLVESDESDAGDAGDGGDAGRSSLLFRRPDTTRPYFLVVDDAAPEFFTRTPAADAGVVADAAKATSDAGDAVGSDAGAARSLADSGIIGAAAARIIDATATDCLEPGLFRVLRSREFLALPAAERESGYRIDIGSSAFFEMCSGAAVACANLPRLAGSTSVAGETAPRLRFGDRIDVVDTALVTPTTAIVEFGEYAIGVATHELMHTLGLGHVLPQLLGDVVVPGTAAGDEQLSLMHSSGSNPNFRNTLQADDVLTLSQLYGGDCEYRDEPRLIRP